MYYTLRSTPDGYRMAKFDEYMRLERIYNILYRRGRFYCDCEAGMKGPKCRHRDELVPKFCKSKAVDKGKFYCYEEDKWYQDVMMKGAA